MMNLEWVGWVATALFASSYVFKSPTSLRRVQALAACLWIAYGIALGAAPVIVANVIVAGTAAFTAFRRTATA